ncbi:MAG: lytic transglycosylase domain-containing protein [Pseudomonadota bacterium]
MRLVLLLFLILAPGASDAREADRISALCEAAGADAARAFGVPVDVLRAIALTETGRVIDGRQRPWPWTVNMEGTGKWFPDRESALAYVREHHARGARSYDVGCFQINYRWHGQAFSSIDAMFDPRENAHYAARFLRSLYAEKGSWSQSAGAYHSRTPKVATRYAARFDRILARLNGGAPLAPPAEGAEYAHNMSAAEGLELPSRGTEPRRQDVRRPARPGPLLAEVPPGWVPPPPAMGSLAAIEHLPSRPPLLTAPGQGLY